MPVQLLEILCDIKEMHLKIGEFWIFFSYGIAEFSMIWREMDKFKQKMEIINMKIYIC